MAVIQGYFVGTFPTQIDNPHIDPGLFELDPITLKSGAPIGWPWNVTFDSGPSPVPSRTISADLAKFFFHDYYFRVHVVPQLVELGTISSPQTRQINVWNAWPYSNADLTDVVPTPAEGVVIEGQATPYSMRPTQELNYDVTIGTTGPPGINIEVLFDFANVQDPPPVVFLGTRAVRFGIVPEVPVTEVWSWLTDIIVATDGTEQRMSVRGPYPRVEVSMSAVFVTREQVQEFYNQLLTVVGRLWIPEYQYAARATAASSTGDSVLYLDTSQTDIRDGEYILIHDLKTPAMVQVDTVLSDRVTLVATLAHDVKAGTPICPGAPALIRDQSSLRRYSVDDAGETQLEARFQRYREDLMRPGAVAQLPTYKGLKVLDKRPLANDLVPDTFTTGQQDVDNDTGVLDLFSLWDYTRVGGSRAFKVNRVQGNNEMDYWREFFSWCRGKCRKFWMPTFRSDFVPFVPIEMGSNFATFLGSDYAQKVYAVPTHRNIEFESAAGVHRAEITQAVVDVLGNTYINFEPNLPSGPGWDTFERISLLLPMRLDSDDVTWEHYGLESIVEFPVRTAEEEEA